MNFNTLEADVNLILSKHFTSGRSGHKIDKVILHHNAGNLTIQGCYNVWQTREASAHYQVQSDGKIGQLVWDKDTAWHAGDSEANMTSIGIEHANNQSGPWTISEKCLDAGAHLTAAVCKFYGLGEPKWLVNVFPHSYFCSTACPGEIAGTQNAAYMTRAKKYYADMTGKTATDAAKQETYKLVAACKVYMSADDAKNKKSSVGAYPAGTYYKYKEYDGMINITKEAGVAGGWINPTTNKVVSNASSLKHKVGETVKINGVYSSSTSTKKLTPDKTSGKITKIISGAKNPYLLDDGNLGWVNDNVIVSNNASSPTPAIKVGSKVKVIKPIDYDSGVSLNVSGTYDVIEVSGNRIVIGKGSAVTAAVHKNNLKLV